MDPNHDSGSAAGRSSSSPRGKGARQPAGKASSPMYLLHLSDLHFGTTADARLWQSQLADDLKQQLNCHRLDAVIVSGDVANFAVKAEYDAAKLFFDQVRDEFKVDRANLVIVPGNHDLDWDLSEEAYTPVKRKKFDMTS